MSLRHWIKKWWKRILSKTAAEAPVRSGTDAQNRKAHEAERLDRLRNPRDYRGK